MWLNSPSVSMPWEIESKPTKSCLLLTRGNREPIAYAHAPEALSNDQVMALLRIAFQQEPVEAALKKMLQEAYSDKSPGMTEA